jgi:hypothetical protein
VALDGGRGREGPAGPATTLIWNGRVDLPFPLPVNFSRKAGHVFGFKIGWFLFDDLTGGVAAAADEK